MYDSGIVIFDILDELRFGNVEDSEISSPQPGQSICLYEYQDHYGDPNYFYYLDNTPTIGNENDRADGNVAGYIKDYLNNPLENVRVIYDHLSILSPIFTLTDTNGYFSFKNYSKIII